MKQDSLRIRPAKRKDMPAVISLVRKLAEFEKLSPPNRTAIQRFIRHGFGPKPYFRVLVVETGRKMIGYAFYFFTYSTFFAKPSLYLEDIFVLPEYRCHGVGERVVRELARLALRKGCGRMDWAVLDWNRNAIRFYKKIGAKHLKEWHFYRLDGKRLKAFIKSPRPLVIPSEARNLSLKVSRIRS